MCVCVWRVTTDNREVVKPIMKTGLGSGMYFAIVAIRLLLFQSLAKSEALPLVNTGKQANERVRTRVQLSHEVVKLKLLFNVLN